MGQSKTTGDDRATPYERGDGNQTSTWHECIAFYQRLAAEFPHWLTFGEVGSSDGGWPVHAGVFSADGDFDSDSVKRAGRTVLFNNNGIHPGEPEGIDVCMALVRDLCVWAERRQRLGSTVLVFVPVYNVDGALNRHDRSRVNQVGPAQFGFRGTARHLDLNRDFIKLDSRNARAYTRLFTAWDPDLLFDTHTSNGADYAHAVTLIATQPDKLGGALGAYLRGTVLPALYGHMSAQGWPMCPYVNPVQETPEQGIADFLDLPRFSTGHAALHHCIGFMPETHMLKSYRQRYEGLRTLYDGLLDFARTHGARLQELRRQDREAVATAASLPLAWAPDPTRVSSFRFHGYRATRAPSRLGRYQRLRYDRGQPYEAEIPYHDRCVAAAHASRPLAYLLPQAWPEVAERLQLNGVALLRVEQTRPLQAEAYRILACARPDRPFEGRHLHTGIELRAEALAATAHAGDWLVPLGRRSDRYVVETLEPLGADSFFRWGFFDAVLDRKETYSDYVFEDEAERLLAAEPALAAGFECWKHDNPQALADPAAVLGYIYEHCERYAEPECRRYPVLRIVAAQGLPLP